MASGIFNLRGHLQIPTSHCDRTSPLISGLGRLDRFERWIVQRESGGNPLRHNPTSSAFGVGQLIKDVRNTIASQFGYDPDTTNLDQQIDMMKAYIAQKFKIGSHKFNPLGLPPSEAAYRWWLAHGWY